MLFQTQSPATRPLTTAHLAQTMTLLELTAAELSQKIEAALASNPALELLDERRCPRCHRRLPATGPCPVCSRPTAGQVSDQPIVFVSPRADVVPYTSRLSEDALPPEEYTAENEDLPTFVLRQIAPDLAPADRPIAAHLLTCLNEDGLLEVPIVEVARYQHVLPSRVEAVLRLIQRAEPVGVGSPTPQQALLVQLEVLAEMRRVPPLAERAIREGMDLLRRHAYPELGRLLHIPSYQASQIARFITENLNPFPGRAHWGSVGQSAANHDVYRDPDIVISLLANSPETQLVVEIVTPYAGSLRINQLFREALAQAPADKVEEWQADLEQANLLVKCLQQRNNTLARLMTRVAVLQREFILQGDAHLQPLTRARLAEELEVHESTVSRAVSGKSVLLPNNRIIPLSKMFDRSLNVRTALRQIVAQEMQPLSDTEIADMLIAQGYPVARRTVAKYRAMEGILPSYLRQSRLLDAVA